MCCEAFQGVGFGCLCFEVECLVKSIYIQAIQNKFSNVEVLLIDNNCVKSWQVNLTGQINNNVPIG